MTEIVKESVTTQNEGPKAAVTTETKECCFQFSNG
jgi:hypothetical protein